MNVAIWEPTDFGSKLKTQTVWYTQKKTCPCTKIGLSTSKFDISLKGFLRMKNINLIISHPRMTQSDSNFFSGVLMAYYVPVLSFIAKFQNLPKLGVKNCFCLFNIRQPKKRVHNTITILCQISTALLVFSNLNSKIRPFKAVKYHILRENIQLAVY